MINMETTRNGTKPSLFGVDRRSMEILTYVKEHPSSTVTEISTSFSSATDYDTYTRLYHLGVKGLVVFQEDEPRCTITENGSHFLDKLRVMRAMERAEDPVGLINALEGSIAILAHEDIMRLTDPELRS